MRARGAQDWRGSGVDRGRLPERSHFSPLPLTQKHHENKLATGQGCQSFCLQGINTHAQWGGCEVRGGLRGQGTWTNATLSSWAFWLVSVAGLLISSLCRDRKSRLTVGREHGVFALWPSTPCLGLQLFPWPSSYRTERLMGPEWGQ